MTASSCKINGCTEFVVLKVEFSNHLYGFSSFQYNADLVAAASPEEIGEDGIEDAFEVVCEFFLSPLFCFSLIV